MDLGEAVTGFFCNVLGKRGFEFPGTVEFVRVFVCKRMVL